MISFKQFITEYVQLKPALLAAVARAVEQKLDLKPKSVRLVRNLEGGSDSFLAITTTGLPDNRGFSDKFIDAVETSFKDRNEQVRFDGVQHAEKGRRFVDTTVTAEFSIYPKDPDALEESWTADTSAKLMLLKKTVADALKLRRYQVNAEIMSMHKSQVRPLGQPIRVTMPATEHDDDREIYQMAVDHVVQKAIKKHFGEYEAYDSRRVALDSAPGGYGIYTIFRVRDNEGYLG